MKKTLEHLRLPSILILIVFLGFVMVRCDDDDPKPVTLYSVSGNITFPFEGGTNAAGGAIVYLAQSATPTTNYAWSAVVDAAGNYTISELAAGDYFMFVNYNTANQNIPGGRVIGINFDSGEGVLFSITDANASQNVTLVSSGQDDAEAVNTTDTGDWSSDFSHSNVDFSFPYDDANADYTGRFDNFDIEIDFDPANLAGSSLSASIDLLSVNTSSPGGRDSFFDTNLGAWDYGCLRGTFGVDTDANDDPVESTRYATFNSTNIVEYGDGYLATGDFTFDGTTNTETLFFRFIEGYVGTNRQGIPTQFSSFEGLLEFFPLASYGIESSHLGGVEVTIDISYQVTKEL